MEGGLHRSFSTLHGLGYLLDGKVGVEPEDNSQSLTRGQLAECSHDREMGCDARSQVRRSGPQGRCRRGAVTAALLATQGGSAGDVLQPGTTGGKDTILGN